MAELYSVNIETGTVFIKALPGEDLTGWLIGEYAQSGGDAALVGLQLVDTSEPYVAQPDDGYIYYRQELGPLTSPSGQRDAVVLTDGAGNVVDEVGWGKDDNFELVDPPADGIVIDPDNGNYAPGDGPTYVDGPPWDTGTDPTDPGGLVPLPPPCFGKGTLIATPLGQVAVEEIKVGQMINTLDGPKPVLWIGSAQIIFKDDSGDHLRPIRFRAGSLGPNIPDHDVLLSPQHRVYCHKPSYEVLFGVAGVLAPAKFFVGRPGIDIENQIGSVEYFHILLDGHHVVEANGLPAESLLLSEWVESRSSFGAVAEFEELFPDGIDDRISRSIQTRYPVLKKHEAALMGSTSNFPESLRN